MNNANSTFNECVRNGILGYRKMAIQINQDKKTKKEKAFAKYSDLDGSISHSDQGWPYQQTKRKRDPSIDEIVLKIQLWNHSLENLRMKCITV